MACLAGVLLALVACDGCDGCGGPDPSVLAVLMATQGPDVVRDHAERQEHWEPTELGDEFRLGDGIRTSNAAEAMLRLADGTQLQLRKSTLVRFMTDTAEADATQLELEMGAAVLTAGAQELRLQTLLGAAIIRSGSRVVLERDAETLRYQVEVGSAAFRSAGGSDEVTVGAGEAYEVGIGEAVFGRVVRSESDPAEVAGDAGVPDAGAAEPMMVFEEDPAADEEPEPVAGDGGSRGEPGLARVSLRVAAGRTVFVHAASGPVSVGFETERVCPGIAVVQVGAARRHGKGLVGVPLPVGRGAYTVRCIKAGKVEPRVVARGRVQVINDAGTRKLPARAPTSRVDADGREYNVFYQNQRPNIVVRWPRAPQAESYTLSVDGKERSVKEAEHTFRSGRLSDGTHKVTFAAAGRRSRPATIVVRFDNAAPKASLTSPAEGGFAPGESVTVEGVALPGWKVAAEGGTITMDEDQRFSGQVVTTAERPDIALRLTHPRLGTHYYLRRSNQPQ
jgi:hypothetical protein